MRNDRLLRSDLKLETWQGIFQFIRLNEDANLYALRF